MPERDDDSGGWRGQLQRTLAAGAPAVGTFVKSADPQVAEILALAGFAVLVADLEHSTLDQIHRATRFPPGGARSLALSHRAAAFGRTPVESFLRDDAARLLTVAQIESRAAVAALPALLAGAHAPDVWFIGPFDLSADLGHPGELEHPDVRAAVDEALDALRGAGATIGAFARDGADARDWRSRGAQLIVISSDVMLLAGSARNAANALG